MDQFIIQHITKKRLASIKLAKYKNDQIYSINETRKAR
ncbi:hypothetical protein BH23THE1_BH23THE1_27110 [soil metagenome]